MSVGPEEGSRRRQAGGASCTAGRRTGRGEAGRRHRRHGRHRGHPEEARHLVSADPASSDAARHHLARRLNPAVAGVEPATPDGRGRPRRVRRQRRRPRTPRRRQARAGRLEVAAHPRAGAAGPRAPGFAGVLSYSLREALWLVREGITDDVVMGYPTRRPGRAARPARRRGGAGPGHADGRRPGAPLARRGCAADRSHGGGWRSTSTPACGWGVRTSAPSAPRCTTRARWSPSPRTSIDRGFSLVGVMTYEGQVAGVPDDVPHQRAKSLVVRKLKSASVAQLEERRAEIAQGLRDVVELEFWNAGGSGSVESTVADPAVTEVAAGSGLLVPGLFDHYQSFEPRPAAFFGLPVVRRPGGGLVTVAGGGFVASGADRQGPAAAPLGSTGPAPDRPRGSRRGADPAHRLGRPPAADRRLGVVPARQVRRARRAHQPGAPARRRRDRRDGAVLPRASGTPGESGALAGPSCELLRSHRTARRPSAAGGCSASTARPGPARRRWRPGRRLAADASVVHMDDLFPGWSGLPQVDAQLDGLLRPLAEGRPGATGATTGWPASSPRPSPWSRVRCSCSRAWAAARPVRRSDGAGLGRGAVRPADGAGHRARRRRLRAALGAVGRRRGRALRPGADPRAGRRRIDGAQPYPASDVQPGSWSSASWSGTRPARRRQRTASGSPSRRRATTGRSPPRGSDAARPQQQAGQPPATELRRGAHLRQEDVALAGRLLRPRRTHWSGCTPRQHPASSRSTRLSSGRELRLPETHCRHMSASPRAEPVVADEGAVVRGPHLLLVDALPGGQRVAVRHGGWLGADTLLVQVGHHHELPALGRQPEPARTSPPGSVFADGALAATTASSPRSRRTRAPAPPSAGPGASRSRSAGASGCTVPSTATLTLPSAGARGSSRSGRRPARRARPPASRARGRSSGSRAPRPRPRPCGAPRCGRPPRPRPAGR